jgi:hypothetical protein
VGALVKDFKALNLCGSDGRGLKFFVNPRETGFEFEKLALKALDFVSKGGTSGGKSYISPIR